jgi:hypothetical protein
MLFEEEDKMPELSDGNPILDDILRHIHDPHSPGNRYCEDIRRWAFEILRTCGAKGLKLVRGEIPLPSRQALSQKPPSGYARSDLTDKDLIVERVRAWRNALQGKIGHKECPRCVLACDALACKPSVEVTSGRLTGIDVSDFEFDDELFERILSSSQAFMDFVHTNWEAVLHAVFVFQIQPLDPELEPFIVYAQPRVDGKAREDHERLLQDLKLLCGKERITIGAFATDGDSGYDPLHERQHAWNLKQFEKDALLMPDKQHYHPISDILHALKRARYRMLKKPPMVVGLTTDSQELDLERLVLLLADDLPAVVFSDDQMTKMHDSLPMVLFRFEILLKIYEAGEFGWVAYFYPWVLINEAMSHKHVDTYDRVGWFQQAYIYLMKITVTYRTHPVGPGITAFGWKKAGPQQRRLLFDRKLLMHTTDSISGIVYEIKKAKKPISLQRVSTVPVERRFGRTRMHAGVHQTLTKLVETMEVDEAMKVLYAHGEVRNRRLSYGETISPCLCLTGIGITPLIFAEAVLVIAGFPAPLSPRLGDVDVHDFHDFAEKLMSDALLPFAKTNFFMMSSRKRRSLYQELHGVTPSSRRIILSSKSELKGVVGRRAVDPIEQHLAELLGRSRVLTEELKLLVTQVCEVSGVAFEGDRSLKRATEREVLDWIGQQWEQVGQTFTTVAANQRPVAVWRPPPRPKR